MCIRDRYLTGAPTLPFAAKPVMWAAIVIAAVNVVGMVYAILRCHHRISYNTWRTYKFGRADEDRTGDLRKINKETPDIPRELVFGSATVVFIDYDGERIEANHVAMAASMTTAARKRFGEKVE